MSRNSEPLATDKQIAYATSLMRRLDYGRMSISKLQHMSKSEVSELIDELKEEAK